MARRPDMPPSMYASRVLGGYAVIPTASTLRGIRRPSERLAVTVDVLEHLDRFRSSIDAVLEDDVILLRAGNTKWSSLARRTGIPAKTLMARVTRRLLYRRRQPTGVAGIVAADPARRSAAA